jgi:hypothetical protein
MLVSERRNVFVHVAFGEALQVYARNHAGVLT